MQSFSHDEAAQLLNVSLRSVATAHKVRAEGQLEVIQTVEAGHLAVSAAVQLAKQPVGLQRAVVQDLESGAAKTVATALKHVRGYPSTDPYLTKAEARWQKRLPEILGYFEEVAASKLVDGLGQRFAEEAIGDWGRALTQLSTVTRQLEGVW